MNVIYLLIPIAIILTVIGIYLFFWAVKTEQFNDLEKQGLSILFDDEENELVSKENNQEIQEQLNPKSTITGDETMAKQSSPSSAISKSADNTLAK